MYSYFTYFRRLLFNIFSILLKMLPQFLKFIRHFPEIFVKFSQYDLTIFSKPFLTFFAMYASSIKYVSSSRTIFKLFPKYTHFLNFFYNMHKVLLQFSQKIVFKMFQKFPTFCYIPPRPTTPTKKH